MVGLLILTLLWAATELLFPAQTQVPGEPLMAFWGFAIPAALSIGKSLINRGGGGDESRSTGPAQGSADQTRGRAAEQEYYDRVSGFDASEGAARTAEVLGRDWREKTKRGRERLTGQQVAAGRLDTGYGYEDQDRYGEDTRREFNDSMARLAMEAQGQQMDVNESLGRYGARVTGRGIDQEMTADAQRRADTADKRGMIGGLGGALIGAAGKVLGAKYGARTA